MSLVAALLVGSSAFAIDNVKASGDAKLFYSTSDTGSVDLFNKAGSAGQAAASLNLSADLTEGISAGTKVTALSTLGLEGQLVGNVWEAPNGLTDTYIVNDLWVAGTFGKSTVKVGRMELDTPLVFTETWSIVENTFESAVLINQDIPNTTLVGAYVGGANATAVGGTGAGLGGLINAEVANSTFSQFYKGAYAVGAVNNSWAPLTAQAWYYDATATASAYWLQADLNMDGILAGALYTSTDLSNAGLPGVTEANGAFAVMLGYEMKDMFTAKVSYSAVDDKAGAGAGGNLAGSGQSKMYTEAWWAYGQVTQVDTTAMTLTVESPVNGMVDLGFYTTLVDHGDKNPNGDLTEVTLTAGKSFGPLDATLAYIYADEGENDTTKVDPDASSTIQAYLTYNF